VGDGSSLVFGAEIAAPTKHRSEVDIALSGAAALLPAGALVAGTHAALALK